MHHDDDLAAIADLTQEYCRALDARDREALAALFVEDARFDAMGAISHGAAAIVDYVAPAERSPHEHVSRHVVGASDVQFDDVGGASATTRFAALIVLSGSPILGGGSYVDRLVRGGDRWQFAERVVTIDVPLVPIEPVPPS